MNRERVGIKFEIHRTPAINLPPEPTTLELPKVYGPDHPHKFILPDFLGAQVTVGCTGCGIPRTFRNFLDMEELTTTKRYFPYRNADWADDPSELDLVAYLNVKEATLT